MTGALKTMGRHRIGHIVKLVRGTWPAPSRVVLVFWVGCFVLTAMLLLSGVIGWRSVSELQPLVQFEHDRRAVGPLLAGTPITVTFPFTNTALHTIRIKEIRASCGCIAYHVDGDTVAPRERGVISVELKTAGQQARVLLRKSVVVAFQEIPSGRMSASSLTVEADLRKRIIVEPEELVLTPDATDQRRTGGSLLIRRELLSKDGFHSLKLDGLRSLYSIEEVRRGDDQVEYRVELNQPDLGQFTSGLRITYVEGKSPFEDIVPVVVARGELAAHLVPKAYLASVNTSWTPAELRRHSTRSFRIMSSSDVDAQLSSVVLSDALSIFEWDASEDDRGPILRLWIAKMPESLGVSTAECEVHYRTKNESRGSLQLRAYVVTSDNE